MPEVTSGLGRNGPWLQNRWLRVDTRQDDGSISPIALDGAFRPTERALASVRPVEAAPIGFERCNYDLRQHEDELGRGRTLTLIARLPRRGVTLRRDIALYDDLPFVVTRIGVTNDAASPLQIAELRTFETAEGRGRLQLDASPTDWRTYRNGWQSWSPTMSFGGSQRDVRSAPPVLSPELPQDTDGRFSSDDVAVLYDPASRRSLLAGAVTARGFVTQVLVDTPARALVARCLVDGVPLAPGATAWSERIAIDLVGAPNEQLARYGDALGALMYARVPPRTMSGWCSWYYFYTQVTEDDVVRNLRFLESHRRELPVDTVQIDDGYQSDIGDWLTVNEKFPRGMSWLAHEIRAAGYTPGIWLAPFLLAESSRTFAAHPDWVVRDVAGVPAPAMQNWQRPNFGVDGSNPEVQSWLTELFEQIVDAWGFDYVKIDFLFAAAIAGVRADPAITRLQAYRAALEAVRAGVGDERFILGCGALMAPSVGIVDGNRIGPDVAPFWRNLTHAERQRPSPRARTADDDLSAEAAIRNALTRSWMHGRLWSNDPDCLLVRTDRTKLTLDETRSLAAAIGLTAGMTLSSNDLDKLPADRLELISMLLPPLPQPAKPVDLLETDMPEYLELVLDATQPARIVALFNFGDEARDLTAPLPPGRWRGLELWDQRALPIQERALSFALVAPHACRVLALSPVTNVPALVATTAHIGMGALDAVSHYDASAERLRLQLLPLGRAHRRLFIAVPPAFTFVAVEGEGVRVEHKGDIVVLDMSVNDERTLDLRFDRVAPASSN